MAVLGWTGYFVCLRPLDGCKGQAGALREQWICCACENAIEHHNSCVASDVRFLHLSRDEMAYSIMILAYVPFAESSRRLCSGASVVTIRTHVR